MTDDTHRTTANNEQSEETSAPVVFKKRRKLAHHFVRKTDDGPEDSSAAATSQIDGHITAVTTDPANAEAPGDSHQEPVLRRPAKHQPKWKTAISVSSRATETSWTATATSAASKPQTTSDPIAGRFVKPSGQVLDADDKLL